jgi:hypothetical protein
MSKRPSRFEVPLHVHSPADQWPVAESPVEGCGGRRCFKLDVEDLRGNPFARVARGHGSAKQVADSGVDVIAAAQQFRESRQVACGI